MYAIWSEFAYIIFGCNFPRLAARIEVFLNRHLLTSCAANQRAVCVWSSKRGESEASYSFSTHFKNKLPTWLLLCARWYVVRVGFGPMSSILALALLLRPCALIHGDFSFV